MVFGVGGVGLNCVLFQNNVFIPKVRCRGGSRISEKGVHIRSTSKKNKGGGVQEEVQLWVQC